MVLWLVNLVLVIFLLVLYKDGFGFGVDWEWVWGFGVKVGRVVGCFGLVVSLLVFLIEGDMGLVEFFDWWDLFFWGVVGFLLFLSMVVVSRCGIGWLGRVLCFLDGWCCLVIFMGWEDVVKEDEVIEDEFVRKFVWMDLDDEVWGRLEL